MQRALRQRDRGALPVDDALPGRVAFATGALQRGVQQPGGQLVPLPEPQRQQSQQHGGRLRAARQASHERRLDLLHPGRGRGAPEELLVGGVDAGHGLETRVPPGLITKAPKSLGEAGAQLRDSGHDHQQLRAEFE